MKKSNPVILVIVAFLVFDALLVIGFGLTARPKPAPAYAVPQLTSPENSKVFLTQEGIKFTWKVELRPGQNTLLMVWNDQAVHPDIPVIWCLAYPIERQECVVTFNPGVYWWTVIVEDRGGLGQAPPKRKFEVR